MSRKGKGDDAMGERSAAKATEGVTARELKAAARRALTVLSDSGPSEASERTALSAAWPDPVLELSPDERTQRVRRGADTVLLDEIDEGGRRRPARGFVRGVLRVPLDHPDAQVYGVFVEVTREGYAELKAAYKSHEPVSVWGTLATRLPLLEDAYGSEVCISEDGSDRRPIVIAARHPLLIDGPRIGPELGDDDER